MSLSEMTFHRQHREGHASSQGGIATFSCLRCLSNLSSRYVRLDRTGVLNGFMIFLTATLWPVSWSFAELRGSASELTARREALPDEAECTHANGLEIGIPGPVLASVGTGGTRAPRSNFKGRAKDLGSHKLSHVDVSDRGGELAGGRGRLRWMASVSGSAVWW